MLPAHATLPRTSASEHATLLPQTFPHPQLEAGSHPSRFRSLSPLSVTLSWPQLDRRPACTCFQLVAQPHWLPAYLPVPAIIRAPCACLPTHVNPSRPSTMKKEGPRARKRPRGECGDQRGLEAWVRGLSSPDSCTSPHIFLEISFKKNVTVTEGSRQVSQAGY